MQVVIRKTKEGFRVIDVKEIRLDEDGGLEVFPTDGGEAIKVGRHKSWNHDRIADFLESYGAIGDQLNLSHISRKWDEWQQAPFA